LTKGAFARFCARLTPKMTRETMKTTADSLLIV
jgi:hypothetical protein